MLTLPSFCSLVGSKVSFFQPDDEVVGKLFTSPISNHAFHCQPIFYSVIVDVHYDLTSYESAFLAGSIACVRPGFSPNIPKTFSWLLKFALKYPLLKKGEERLTSVSRTLTSGLHLSGC